MSQKSVVLATAGYDHNIRFWEATGVCHRDRTLEYKDSQVNALAISMDKCYLAAAGNPHIRLFRIDSNQPMSSFDGHSNNVTAVGFQRDRKWIYSGSEDGTIKIWDIRTPGYQCNYLNKPHNGTGTCAAVNSVALHPNQGELISCDEKGVIRVWDLTANKCSFKLSPDSKTPLRSLCIATDASVCAAANNRGALFVTLLLSFLCYSFFLFFFLSLSLYIYIYIYI